MYTLALLALLQIRAKEKAVILYVALLLNNKNVCGIINLSNNFTVILQPKNLLKRQIMLVVVIM